MAITIQAVKRKDRNTVEKPIVVTASGLLKNGVAWRPNGATTNGSPGGGVSDGVINVNLAVNLGLDMLRLTDFIDKNGTLGVAEYDAAVWAVLDNQIALCAARGIMVELDLACYRNLLMQQSVSFKWTAYDWTPFLTWVANRVNTVTGTRYGSDPAIGFISFAGETEAPDHADSIARGITKQNLIDFYSTVTTTWAGLAPGMVRMSGGLYFLTDSTMPWREIFALPTVDLPAIHSYSGSDEGMQSTVAAYCTSIGKPWFLEEFGISPGNYASDAARATDFDRKYDLGLSNGTCGIVWWNCDSGSIIPATYPLTVAAIKARTTLTHSGTYRFFRFKPTALRTPGGNVQLSEFALLSGSTVLPGCVTTGIAFGGNSYEAPEHATDSLLSTKWNSTGGVADGLIFDLGFPTAVTGYRWATGNDATGRDPVQWVFSGSTNGTTWTALDTQTAPSVTTSRSTWTADFTF